jgi:hypothetical protein
MSTDLWLIICQMEPVGHRSLAGSHPERGRWAHCFHVAVQETLACEGSVAGLPLWWRYISHWNAMITSSP